jgi:hypothetical protein
MRFSNLNRLCEAQTRISVPSLESDAIGYNYDYEGMSISLASPMSC